MVVLSDVPSMFWGVTLDGSGKKYTQTVERSFHISMAALEPNPSHKKDDKGNNFVSIMVQHDQAEFMICTLEHGRLYNQFMDLNFAEGEEVTFFLNGKGIVHLTGYLDEGEPEEEEEDEEDSEDSDYEPPELLAVDEEDDEDSSDEDDITVESGKRKMMDSSQKSKKKQRIMELDSEEDDDDEDDDEEMDANMFLDLEAEEDNEWMDDDDEEDEEETSFEGSFLQKKDKTKGKDKKKASKESPTKKKKEEQTPSKQDQPAQNGDSTTEKKKKKKKKKKNKNKGDESPGSTPQSQSKPGTPAGTPKESPSKSQTPASGKKQKHKKQVLEGGLLVEDVKEGHGPEAKPGKMIHVYYKGTLSKNGKTFDSNLTGKPFRFKLGKKEVIQGWDSGLKGMKVGGKRKLTVPPKMGYGGQRAGEIPPNSTLIFDVELKAVS